MTIKRKITHTTVSIATVEMIDGEIFTNQLEDLVLNGNVSIEKAQKIVDKEIGNKAMVLEVNTETNVYEMSVENFIKNSTIKGDE